MQDYFYTLADTISTLLRGQEIFTCAFHGEDSDFVRFNRSAVRQPGTVTQRVLRLDLIAAMQNEMGHVEDFLVKLLEYGFKPAWTRWAYWLVGWFFGFGSRILGRRWILKTGVWVEAKAVHHYSELLETIEWDEDTRPIIEKDQQDERHHIQLWESLMS